MRRKQTKGGGRTHLRDSLFENASKMGLSAEANKEYQVEAILNACIHPSLVACQMATVGADWDAKWFPFFGLVSEFSVRTLEYSILSMLDYLGYGWTPDYGDKTEALLHNELTKCALIHVRHGRSVLLELGAHMIDKVNAGEL
jgi:hypothetical protein